MEFINNPESEVVEKLEMSKDEIKEAKDELIKLSCNPKERELYEKRKESILNKVSALESAEKKGRDLEKIEIAKNMIESGLDDILIANITGLKIDVISNLRDK